MSGRALAEDAVAIRRVSARGIGEAALRRQLAAVPTPRVRPYVLVRRVRIRAGPQQIGRAMAEALSRLADGGRSEVLAFADFPALAVACAWAALAGGIGTAWQWRALGVPAAAGPGEAIGALLTAHPLEAGSVVAALAEQGLLAQVWRNLPEAAAARLIAALAHATGFLEPAWPVGEPDEILVHPSRLPTATASLLARAHAAWAPILAPLPPRSEAVRAAAVLALLRWSPASLRSGVNSVWPALLAHITGRGSFGDSRPGTPAGDRAPVGNDRTPNSPYPAQQMPPAGFEAPLVPRPNSTLPAPPEPGISPVSEPAHGKQIATGWGGVLFLINALQRIDIETMLAAAGADAPSGWRLLHDLGAALGLPQEEPMAYFLAGEDLETIVPPGMLGELLVEIEALYRPDGPWPLPLAQPALLRATEAHLDLELTASTIDPALRLSGLDLDPGWVPWLGRVVRFHYEHLPTYYGRIA